MNHTHLVIGELEQPLGPSDSQKILDFLSLQSNAARSFRADLDVTSRMAQCSQQLEAHSAYELWVDASSGNAESCLELGLRLVFSFVLSLTTNPRLGCILVAVLLKTPTLHWTGGVGYRIPRIVTLSDLHLDP